MRPWPWPPLPQSVFPGDVLMALPETGVVRIGGGVQQDGELLVATKAGVLRREAKGGKLWVEARQKRWGGWRGSKRIAASRCRIVGRKPAAFLGRGAARTSRELGAGRCGSAVKVVWVPRLHPSLQVHPFPRGRRHRQDHRQALGWAQPPAPQLACPHAPVCLLRPFGGSLRSAAGRAHAHACTHTARPPSLPAENYGVDIGGPFRALLPVLAFEGATKRNRPHLQVGDLVYGRVESAHRDLEPVLSCMDGAGKVGGCACACITCVCRCVPWGVCRGASGAEACRPGSCCAAAVAKWSGGGAADSRRSSAFGAPPACPAADGSPLPARACLPAWMQASGFAQLKGGMVIEVSTTHARSLLRWALQGWVAPEAQQGEAWQGTRAGADLRVCCCGPRRRLLLCPIAAAPSSPARACTGAAGRQRRCCRR